ncbi:MAG: EamA family transporter [Betaproteobacteria bacterium]|nr:EamA family transporter [Betaproteobacteria bacterium]
MDALLAWYFVSVWGSGYLATKVGLRYAPPFTFLTLRYALGLALMAPLLLVLRPRWPAGPRELGHVVVAGLLMHAVQLGASHYAQYLGMSAGIAALIISSQPLFTALIASRWLGERLVARQWAGVMIGLAGVALVVWHKIDVREIGFGSLLATVIALAGVTAGTLYQRVFCPSVDLYGATCVQFVATLATLAPLAVVVEGFRVHWAWQLGASLAYLVVLSSILAVNVLHTLMRHGQATRVTSMMYLPPLIAVALEYALFGVAPGVLAGIGIAVTCLGVALTAWHSTRAPSAAAVD